MNAMTCDKTTTATSLSSATAILAVMFLTQNAWDGIHYRWTICAESKNTCPLIRIDPMTKEIEQYGLSYPGQKTYAPKGCSFMNIPKVTLVCEPGWAIS